MLSKYKKWIYISLVGFGLYFFFFMKIINGKTLFQSIKERNASNSM